MSTQKQRSKYAEKRDRGMQMYGPGCCGHKLTLAQLDAHRLRIKKEGHFFWTPAGEAERRYRDAINAHRGVEVA